MSFLRIENITKNFGGNKVLDNVGLSVKKGDLITLLGPSGCGKSTLLRIVAGLITADSGSIAIDGQEIMHKAPKDREVGMVFQSYALFPNMTVFDNIAFGLQMQGLKKEIIRERVEEMINMVDLVGKEDSFPHQLSGGQ